ncbi:hypothetical protein G7Y89_g11944 [Cudoniella acicularis]|uniref:Uncharacterized protein n=1 Tax=Cudoniella acicularis TaxID=354080 RepID=A0A8H4VXU6_9HELO|nr:hypothetical protein G7Y89_g11944 [Cudoniella acicularis]
MEKILRRVWPCIYEACVAFPDGYHRFQMNMISLYQPSDNLTLHYDLFNELRSRNELIITTESDFNIRDLKIVFEHDEQRILTLIEEVLVERTESDCSSDSLDRNPEYTLIYLNYEEICSDIHAILISNPVKDLYYYVAYHLYWRGFTVIVMCKAENVIEDVVRWLPPRFARYEKHA